MNTVFILPHIKVKIQKKFGEKDAQVSILFDYAWWEYGDCSFLLIISLQFSAATSKNVSRHGQKVPWGAKLPQVRTILIHHAQCQAG